MWHTFHLLAHPAQAELGEDGHPAAGRFLPPLPDRRRMFAGGRLEVQEPLRLGDTVTRRSSLAAVTPRTGRSGAMVFVTERHGWARDGRVVVIEEQDYAYRSQPAATARDLPVSADEPYVTGVEGYPGLVVHGPLLALLLLELPRRFAPGRTVTEFSYRLRSPVFAGSTVEASGRPGALVAGLAGAAPAITGAVTLV